MFPSWLWRRGFRSSRRKTKNPPPRLAVGFVGSKPRQHPTAAPRSSSAMVSSRVFTFKFIARGYRQEAAVVKSYFSSALFFKRLFPGALAARRCFAG
jgi:hypothetical protein